MRVRVLLKGGETLVRDAVLVLVENHRGDPLAVALDLEQGDTQLVSHAQDKEFVRILSQLGVDRLTVTEPIRLAPREELPVLF